MYAVLFKAVLKSTDEQYLQMANKLRELAVHKYGCLEFVSLNQDNQEISISYWPDEENIKRWKQDPEHRLAQELGRSKWYESYRIEVVKVLRAYGYPADASDSNL